MDLSIVIPVYQAQNILEKLISRIKASVTQITENYEIILVEDYSTDNSWNVIKTICENNKMVKGIKFSRNFGQHFAITAGLKKATGEWIVVMDCDLQDRPEEIINLHKKAQEGFDLVYAKRAIRKDVFLKKLSSRVFYSLFAYLTDTKQDSSVANFGIYHKKVIDAILEMKDHIRYFPTMSQWVGFSKGYVIVTHSDRDEGKSSYSWRKLLNLAFDNIISFSDKPLRLTIKFGLLISLISGVMGIVSLINYFNGKIEVLGYTSLIISLWFLSGIIIFILGVIGIYIGKTFDQVKNRPLYIIEDKLNL